MMQPKEIVCRPNRKKNQDWFRGSDEGLNKLLKERKRAKKNKQLSRNIRSNKAKLVEARSKLQR